MDEREEWHFGGRYYGITWTGSLDNETTDVELDDLGPAPERGCVASVVFPDRAPTEPTFVQHSSDALPLALVEKFIQAARHGQPAASVPPATGCPRCSALEAWDMFIWNVGTTLSSEGDPVSLERRRCDSCGALWEFRNPGGMDGQFDAVALEG